METYSLLREIADSWVLIALMGFFVGAGIWAYLPSQHAARVDASEIPFRNETPRQHRESCKDRSDRSFPPEEARNV